MKKALALLLTVCSLALLVTGCGSSSKEYNLDDVMSAIEAVAPVPMAADIDDDFLTGMYGISMDDVVEYKGKYSNVNIMSDEILIVKAAKGKTDTIKAAFEARRQAKYDQCNMYLQPLADKAQNGRIVVKGDYVLLVIAGDNDRIANGEVDQVYAEIDTAINNALA